ncbi:hypothetical protein TRAPUB_8447 [Trametes pubescens]|uniref:Uncharacterized protein n=1 Tax=Trametes pubescens TaxID=154538 RepID=A0A1M2W555_TRAPU|nr:hypothetical protein TRAPUB_8447 [Trametes pubescens]
MKDSRVINLPNVHGRPRAIRRAKHLIDALGPANPAFDAAIDTQRPRPWPGSPHPHPKTTRLSRFRDGITPSVTDATPLARTIYQARCEVAADTVATPVSAAISADCSALALVGAGGWKNRDPTLTIYYLDEPAAAPNDDEDDAEREEIRAYGGFRRMALEPGLADVAHAVAMDDTHLLALVADADRIKTFAWGGDVAFGGWTPARGTNVHTLDSERHDGPVAVFPGGRVARAGRGGVALWSIEGLATHEGGRRVGRKLNIEGVWRDNDDGEI